MPQAAPIISVGLGALGLLQANDQARKQANAQKSAVDLNQQALDQAKYAQEPIIQALYKMLNLADSYNPQQETSAAVQRASETTQHTLERALGGLNAKYRSQGGTPGLSSEFNVRAQGLTDRVTDPLREFVANQRVNEFARKLAAYQSVNGGNPGNLASNFFQASQNQASLSQMFQPNYGGSLNLLGNALQQLLNKPGADTSNDLRQAVNGMAQNPWRVRLGSDNYMNYSGDRS